MLDAAIGVLRRLAAAGPVLLVIEDVHWADTATRDVLGYLLTRFGTLPHTPIGLIVTVRSDAVHRRHPMRVALAEWTRLPSVRRLHLDPLDPAHVRALLRRLDATVDDAAVADIVRRAEGNAFFAEELLESSRRGDPDIPEALADVLLVRLDRLGDDARRIVRAVAVGGRGVSHDLVRAIAGLPDDRVEAGLREAIDAHVLQTTAESPGRPGYRFRHALLEEAVYDDLLPGERVRMHAAAAAAAGPRPRRRRARRGGARPARPGRPRPAPRAGRDDPRRSRGPRRRRPVRGARPVPGGPGDRRRRSRSRRTTATTSCWRWSRPAWPPAAAGGRCGSSGPSWTTCPTTPPASTGRRCSTPGPPRRPPASGTSRRSARSPRRRGC